MSRYLLEEFLNGGHQLGLVPLDEELVEVGRLSGAELQKRTCAKGLTQERIQELLGI